MKIFIHICSIRFHSPLNFYHLNIVRIYHEWLFLQSKSKRKDKEEYKFLYFLLLHFKTFICIHFISNVKYIRKIFLLICLKNSYFEMFILLLSVSLTYNLNQEIYKKQKVLVIVIKKLIFVLIYILNTFVTSSNSINLPLIFKSYPRGSTKIKNIFRYKRFI